MKSIENKDLNQYNENFQNRDQLDKYLQVNIAHLQEDMDKCKNFIKTYNDLDVLMKKCCEIHLLVLNRKLLEEKHIKIFEEINKYNDMKNKEIKRLAILTGVFAIIAILTGFIIK